LRVGLLGGTFDPIHLGHLRAAECAREALGLGEVIFVPSSQPPHRSGPSASALDRWAMVCLATSGNPAFVASSVELERAGPSYTMETVLAIRAARPADELVLIVGSDAFPEMARWRQAASLFAACEVAVVSRPGAHAEPATPAAPPFPDVRGIRPVAGSLLPISASHVRELAREGRSIRYLVPEPVAGFVAKRGLYR
jgi:nicotinate-nucleotide adenylyltransferase